VLTSEYAETISLIERLHRRFLDVLRVELDRLGVTDINNAQGLLLANIGRQEVSVGELMSRGYYLGSNVTYNLKRLVEADYVAQERSQRDRRVVRVRLTERGLQLSQKLALILEHQSAALEREPGMADLAALNDSLRALERFWSEKATIRP
jgi:DNA-binding MarR family transcriptional regulator